MMTNHDDLWSFSLRLYKNPQIQTACLTLQNKYNADVNILLFLLFQGSGLYTLTPDSIRQIDCDVRSFREGIIWPIRTLRQSVKGKTYHEGESLYATMLDLELSAEKYEQALLDTLPFEKHIADTAKAAVRHNLDRYANYLGIPLPNKTIENLIRYSAT